ncbi:MAG TPA: glycine cleavage system aminomethyltransferase GcvT [Peptococcaceae bacterium]|nr:glycine cleavage system aminomethyltransferase GcvT [Peptococcaceae bacterium]
MKKTPLYDLHLAAGGKIIDFGGWALPVEYEGILKEHETVRSAAGLFDVSHMGEILVQGPDAEKFLQKMLTNDISTMQDYQVYYTLMCYPDGGVVDDLIVYRYKPDHYLLVVNAANTAKDFAWLKEHEEGQVIVTDVSEQYAQLALQGPLAQTILQALTATNLNEVKFFRFLPGLTVSGIPALVSRTGYTGEDGFELYVEPAKAPELWQAILAEGQKHGLKPIGLGARDTLRFEAALPLYGHELSPEITPLEAGLGMFVKLNKADFIGKEALAKQKAEGVPRKLVGFEMIERGLPRSEYEVQKNGKSIGHVTTGGLAPSLKKNVGLALIESQYAQEGETIEIVIRKNNPQARIIPKPFYQKRYKKT